MKLAIIGTGNMGRAISTRAVAAGYSVTFYARNTAKARALADELGAQASVVSDGSAINDPVVFLAVPYSALDDIAQKYAKYLDGKIVVDITNPVDFQTYELLTKPGNSAAEQLAKMLPRAQVIKAFNTTLAATLAEGKVAGLPLDVFMASDIDSAKKTLAKLIIDMRLRPLDVGPLKNAFNIEAMQLVHFAVIPQVSPKWLSSIKILS